MKCVLIMLLSLLSLNPLHATADSLRFPQVHLNEVVIRSFPEGFGADDFIDIIQNDTTFYKAFKSLHLVTYSGIHDIKVLHKKKNEIIARYEAETKQIYRNGCRNMHVLEEKVTGDFFKRNGDYKYFTATLYDQLFFTKEERCGENNIVKGSLEDDLRGKNRIEKSKVQLKHLIFNPGKPIAGLPGIGKKVGIFEPDMVDEYDFNIELVQKHGEWCYEFTAKPKEGHYKKLVIKSWKTWLRKSDFTILSRDYHLSYNVGVYDFDVKIYVDLKEHRGVLLPAYISYDGNWYFVSQGRERVKFEGKFYY